MSIVKRYKDWKKRRHQVEAYEGFCDGVAYAAVALVVERKSPDAVEALSCRVNVDPGLLRNKVREESFDRGIRHFLRIYEELHEHDCRNMCSVGVGDGDGNLFVYGRYLAVKRVQDLLLGG